MNLGNLPFQPHIKPNRRESYGDERDSYRGLDVPRGSAPSRPLGEVAIEGCRGRQRSHKLSFSLATEWRNARTTLPPNL